MSRVLEIRATTGLNGPSRVIRVPNPKTGLTMAEVDGAYNVIRNMQPYNTTGNFGSLGWMARAEIVTRHNNQIFESSNP